MLTSKLSIQGMSGYIRRSRMLLVVVGFAVISSAIVLYSRAATSSVAYETEAGGQAGGVTTVADATASNASAVRFAASAGATVYGWQLTSANTGLAAVGLTCNSLPAYTGPEKVAANTTISNKKITIGLDLSAGNITIDRVCFKPTSAGIGYPLVTTTDTNICDNNGCQPAQGKVTITNSEFDGSLLGAQEAAFTTAFIGIADLKNNYIHDFGSGIGLMNTGKSFSAVIEGNYVTRLKAYGDGGTTGNHSDGFTIRDLDASTTPGRNAVVRNNRFDCNSGNDTGALFLQTYAGRIDNVTIIGNLLEGGGYQMGLNLLNSPYSNIVVTNNRMTNTGYGAAYVQGGAGYTTWSENYVNDATKPDNKGAVIAKPN